MPAQCTWVIQASQILYAWVQDLRDLFRVVASELDSSETQRTLHQLHAHQRIQSDPLNQHLHFLQTLPRYAGLIL